MKKTLTNVGASIRARLMNETRRRNADFQLILQRYAAERFLYRLGVSHHREQFVLKGALLFVLWDEALYRPTRDVDLAGYWANDAASLKGAFEEICAIACPEDGLSFLSTSLKIVPIRDRSEYKGFRLRFQTYLEDAVIPMQVDVGFGDAVVPPPMEADYPVLLDAPAPRITVYPREAAVAEKLHAMVTLGLANSRFKDFYDIYALSSRFAFAGETLSAAIAATFSRRSTPPLVETPPALTPSFYEEADRALQWRRYLDRGRFGDAPADFAIIGSSIRAFLDPPLRAVVNGRSFARVWPLGGPWR